MSYKRTEDNLSPMGKYVLVHYNGGNWMDSTDQDGVYWVVAKRMPCQAICNNTEPYYFKTFGPKTFFSWQIDDWRELFQK